MKRNMAAQIAALMLLPSAAFAAPAYTLVKTVPLGPPDRWDYVVFDHDSGRVYVAHADRLSVVDSRSAKVIGEVTGIPGGTHGIGVSHVTGKGFTDDGKNGQAVAFDLKTLKVTKQIPTADDADAIAMEPVTGHVFVMDGDAKTISVIDPHTDKVVASIAGGENLEYGAADGKGFFYISGAGSRDLIKIDARTNTVVAHFPTPDCASPHGLAIDSVNHRAFMGCINSQLMVLDTNSGTVVTKLPIGRGSDAIAFDPMRKRVFSTNGVDGTISVYQQVSPDKYEPLETVKSQITGRTMSVDPKTGRLFVAAMEVSPPATPGGAPQRKPGTLSLLMFDPTK
ncbi:MAG: YncE family protein [Caulobacteraceae bacterium]|nr:YncE family protein [Caulobacteraceae bacterium]